MAKVRPEKYIVNSLILSKNPEEEELESKQSELEALESDLVQKELDLFFYTLLKVLLMKETNDLEAQCISALLEKQRIAKLQEQERIKQEEQDKLILDQILPLIKNEKKLASSPFKAKVYLCLTKMIAEEFDTDESYIKWQTNFEIDLKNETYQEYLSRVNNSGSWGSGSGGLGSSSFDASCVDFIMSLEELLDIEITDEESERCLTDVGSLVDYIISRFKDNPEKLEQCVTKYILDNVK